MENSKYTRTGVFMAALVIFVVMIALFILSSCASSHVASGVADRNMHQSATTVVATDSTSHMETHHDSIVRAVHQYDTIHEVRDVVDSIIIDRSTETVITKVVSTDGTVLGTDKVTTNTVSRDHYRTADNSTHRISNTTDASVQKTDDSSADRCVSVRDTSSSKVDSVSHDAVVVQTSDSRSWWQRLWDRVGSTLLNFLLAGLAVGMAYLIVRYWTGK